MVDWGRAQDVSETGRLARRPSRVRRGGGRLWLAALAIVGGGLALSGGAYATVGGNSIASRPPGTAIPGVNRLISPQYQAKNTDTAVPPGPQGPAADPSGGDAPDVAAWADPTPNGGSVRYPGREATWYRARALQYQLPANIAELTKARIASDQIRSSHPIDQSIVPRINRDKVISNTTTGLSPQDARRLLQLALFLGLSYVLFVVFWLWRTRGRSHGTGRVVRY